MENLVVGRGTSKAELYDAFAVSGKALANGTHLELLGLTTASAYLQTLKQAGFVTTRRERVRVHYRLAGEDVARLFALLRQVAQAHQPAVPAARDAFLGPDSSTEIGRAHLHARAEAGEVVVLDVRPVHEYRAGHIPGAVSIPVHELGDRITELPGETEIVVCCGEYCALAYEAVRLLTDRGRRAIRLQDGMLEWRLTDLPITTGESA